MDERAQYIFAYRGDLLTVSEREAWRMMILRSKAQSADNAALRRVLESRMSNADEVLALLDEGDERFLERAVERVISEHGESVFARCPKCGAILRTPRAKQCAKCFYDWH